MKKDWQSAFGKMTYGIYVLTSSGRGEEEKIQINGMIASWVVQVSYEPPMILAAIHPDRYSHKLLSDHPVFGLHIIKQSQSSLLKRFKGPDPGLKFEGLEWETQKTGVPILRDCVAWFELEVRQQLSPGNHTLFIGEVVNAGCNNHDTSPLCTIDYDGYYTGKS